MQVQYDFFSNLKILQNSLLVSLQNWNELGRKRDNEKYRLIRAKG